jgi:hypothetical protein
MVNCSMTQLQLPIFQEGTCLINEKLGYQRQGDQVIYLHSMMPVFLDQVEDIASF